MTETSTSSERAPLPPSPCVGICALKGDYCYGCGRTGDEIASWGSLSAHDQSAVWAELPGRLAAFGFKTFRLAAGPAIINDFIGRSFRETTGRWRLVSPSLEGHLAISAMARPEVTEADREVSAIASGDTKLTLTKHDRVRAFGFSSRDDAPRMDTVALVLPKGRAQRDLKETEAPEQSSQSGSMPIALPGTFATASLCGVSGLDNLDSDVPWTDQCAYLAAVLTQGTARLRLHNALGTLETPNARFSVADPDANAPTDVKISKAFVACAIFHADDPEWLAAALAP